jgi:hypothetical protein
MTDAATEPRVLDVAEWSRFEIHLGGKLAGYANYALKPGRITFTHTVVHDEFGGRGLGGKLARVALDVARKRGLEVYPDCPFIRAWIGKHPDYLDLVPEAVRDRYQLA